MNRQIVSAIWRVLFAFGVTYIFTIVLLTAAAQQQVTAALAASSSKLDYSSAYARVREVEDIQRQVAALAKQEQTLAREHQQAEFRLRELASASDEAWNEFMPIATRLMARGDCDRIESQDPLALWNWFTRCVQAVEIAPRERAVLNELISQSPNPGQRYRDMLSQERLLDRAQADLLDVRERLSAARASAAEGETLRGAFDEMDVLRDAWWSGAGMFVHFPPILLQILLALAAGAFGALLLTIILTVYPSNGLQFVAGQGFELRVLLGGLIAVGVYVVLSGGASVLGGSPGISAGSSNVMTFCAVGILAGMFSDRVASWLSEKADVFFALNKEDAERTTDG
jgi:hypothetical protein